MTHPVQTVTAETRAELEVKVQLEIAKGWVRIGNLNRLLIGGQPAEGRPRWAQIMERK